MNKIFFLIIFILSSSVGYSQPYFKVGHLSGTRNIGCVDVDVVTQDVVTLQTAPGGCPATPWYWLAHDPMAPIAPMNGSVTFTFSTPVDAIRLELLSIHPGIEVISVFVNSIHVNFSILPYSGTVSSYNTGCTPVQPITAILPSGDLTGPSVPFLSLGSVTIDLSSALPAFAGGITTVTVADVSTSFAAGAPTTVSFRPFGPVTPVPPITGNTIMCTGSTTNLSNALAGGTWSSDNIAVATVTGAGLVTGVSAGTTEITYAVPGNCWVTTTVTVEDNTGPCSACLQMPGTYTTIPGGAVMTDIPPGNYHVTGDITISPLAGFLTATDAVLFIDPGVHIYVDAFSSLTLKGCHLFSCGGMWEGIELRTSGSATGIVSVSANAVGRPTLIEDAVTAIKVDAPAFPCYTVYFIDCNNAIFNKNNTGIEISNYTVASSSIPGAPLTYGFNVENTVFTCRNFSGTSGWPAVWPRINGVGRLKSTFGSNPYAAPYKLTDGTTYPTVQCNNNATNPRRFGIVLDKVGLQYTPGVYGGMVIGAANTNMFCWGENYEQNIFDNLAVGVYGINANIVSRNSAFCNMVEVLDPQPKWGYGIFTENTNNGQYSLVVEPSSYASPGCGTTQSTNLFYDCARTCVYSSGYYAVKGRGATMRSSTQSNAGGSIDQMRKGYEIYSCPFEEVTLTNNTILNIANGIIVGKNVPLAPGPMLPTENRVTIMNNHIRASAAGAANNSTRYVDKAITVYGINSAGSYTTVMPVTINQNTLADVYNGILLQDMDEQTSTTNYNTITTRLYPAGGWAANDQYGIYHEACVNDATMENTITGEGHAAKTNYWGVKMKGNSWHYVACNKATKVGTGFEFSDVTSGQTSWLDNTMTNNQRGFVVSGGTMLGVAQGSALWPAGNKWTSANTAFAWTGGNLQTYTNGASPTNSSMWTNPGLMRPSNNAGVSIPSTWYGSGGSSGNGLLSTSVIYLYARCLPIRIVSPAVITGVVVIPRRVAQNDITYGQHEQQHAWMAQMNLYRALRLYPEFDKENTLTTFKSMAARSRYGILTRIEQQLATGNPRRAEAILASYALEDGATTEENNATGVRMADDVAVNNIVANYRRFYEICIRYADTTMTGDDSTDIETMAMLCPETEGGAVYKARAMYNLLHHTVRIFSANCDTLVTDTTGSIGAYQQGNEPWNIASANGEVTNYGLYPNPNNGNFILQQTTMSDKPVDIVIWDAVGRTVYERSILFTGSRAEIHMEHNSPGVYMMQVTDANKHKQRFKLLIK